MKAGHVMIGMYLQVEESGKLAIVTGVSKCGAFRMALDGHPDKAAIEIRHSQGSTLCHPDENLEVVE
jgi:hypothetical protein